MPSETDPQRTGPILQALADFRADPSLQKRGVLFAAFDAAGTLRFYTIGPRLFAFGSSQERFLANCRTSELADLLRDRLNADLALGWTPDLNVL